MHYGLELCRREDMISLIYTLVFTFAENLPWSVKLETRGTLRLHEVRDQKSSMYPEKLCERIAKELVEITRQVIQLEFREPVAA